MTTFLTGFAVYFVIWWITLFAVLPIGVRTQEEENDVVFGTAESAPAVPRLWRKVILTSVISGVIYAAYWATGYFGLSFDSIPRIVPDFRAD